MLKVLFCVMSIHCVGSATVQERSPMGFTADLPREWRQSRPSDAGSLTGTQLSAVIKLRDGPERLSFAA